MKVLFLDIDGVLNCDSTKEKIEGVGPLYDGSLGVDKRLVSKFHKWLDNKDVEIVLSSTWRLHEPLYPYLNANGIYWFSITPRERSWSGGFSNERGKEVSSWLKYDGKDVTHYAILDDSPVKHNHLVMTPEKYGLQHKHLKLVDRYLGFE